MASLRHGVEEPGDVQDIRLVVDTIPTLAWSARPDGSAEFHNQRWLDYTGLSPKQALGSGWAAAVHPDDLPRILETFREALNTGKPYEVEGRFRRFDGEFRWFLFRGGPLRDRSGNVAKWYGTNTDLEERKRAEETLQRSEGYLAEAQKLTTTGSWAVHVPETENAQGEACQALAVIPRFGWDASYWSKEMYWIFGLDPGPTPPSSMEVVRRLDPEDAQYNTPLVEQAIRDRTDFETDYRLLLPNGPAKYIHVVGHPVVNASGDVIELVGTAMDVTERKRAEDSLRASEASLLDAQRLT